MTFFLLMLQGVFAVDVSQFDINKIKIGTPFSEVRKKLDMKKYHKKSDSKDGYGVYSLLLKGENGEQVIMNFTQDENGRKLYRFTYIAQYYPEYLDGHLIKDPLYRVNRCREMGSQLIAKYGEPTNIKDCQNGYDTLSYCWGDCNNATYDEKEGHSLTATTLGNYLTLQLDDYTLAKEVMNSKKKAKKKQLFDFMALVTKYSLGLPMPQADKIFRNTSGRNPHFRIDSNSQEESQFEAPQLDDTYAVDSSSIARMEVSFTGKGNAGKYDNKIYKVESMFTFPSWSKVVYRQEIINRFVKLYGPPDDTIEKEDVSQVCWGQCMKNEHGKYNSMRVKMHGGPIKISAGQKRLLSIWDDAVTFEQFDFTLACEYGKAKNESRRKTIEGIKNKELD